MTLALTSLLQAVRRNDLRAVQEDLSFGAEPNERTTKAQTTAMHAAVRKRNADIVREICLAGGDPDLPEGENEDGPTPMQLARDEEIKKILEEARNSRDASSMSHTEVKQLVMSAYSGNKDAYQKMVDAQKRATYRMDIDTLTAFQNVHQTDDVKAAYVAFRASEEGRLLEAARRDRARFTLDDEIAPILGQPETEKPKTADSKEGARGIQEPNESHTADAEHHRTKRGRRSRDE
jgi:hypothetical protein